MARHTRDNNADIDALANRQFDADHAGPVRFGGKREAPDAKAETLCIEKKTRGSVVSVGYRPLESDAPFRHQPDVPNALRRESSYSIIIGYFSSFPLDFASSSEDISAKMEIRCDAVPAGQSAQAK
jgi:hypothetical protein